MGATIFETGPALCETAEAGSHEPGCNVSPADNRAPSQCVHLKNLFCHWQIQVVILSVPSEIDLSV